jgi:hypothetical protein
MGSEGSGPVEVSSNAAKKEKQSDNSKKDPFKQTDKPGNSRELRSG